MNPALRAGLLPALLLGACADAAEDDGIVDRTVELPAPGPDGAQLLLPEAVVEGYADTQLCTLLTWDGPDVGVTAVTTYQAAPFGHHLLLYGTRLDPDAYPDGTTFDCADPATMQLVDPLFFTEPWEEDEELVTTRLELPGALALRLDQGQRFLAQSHYVNSGPDPIRVQDAVNLTLVEADTVETWAAPWGHGTTDMPLPPGADTTLELRCAWSSPVNLLSMMGHMHEAGRSFSVDHQSGDTTTRLYEVETWTAEYRDTPPVSSWELPGLPVAEGDVFTTTCAFHNDGDETLDYPEEMCASFGIAWPAEQSLLCAADVTVR
jgi:hypothetical protein